MSKLVTGGSPEGWETGKGVDGAACQLQAASLESWEVDMGSRGQGLPVHGGLSRRAIFLSPFKSSEPEETSNRGFSGVAEGWPGGRRPTKATFGF